MTRLQKDKSLYTRQDGDVDCHERMVVEEARESPREKILAVACCNELSTCPLLRLTYLLK
ncbi:hypothetical protein F441_15843 [Phytophthora nicotianae CJ01A1]|uniref:Uncharacterized protein n=2 Tax=Phytophthora nicotianae TaxID=4792 RepID=W2WBY3_PHYNI|nr:hypothetical protein F444_15989 [Phytophthora nicotianae P1976]ETP08065.1 hypothetical protein F441_15843 [Phytophthora nicotianae CJ01A1]